MKSAVQNLTALLIDVGNSHTRIAGWRSSDRFLTSSVDGGPFGQVNAKALPRLGSWPTAVVSGGGEQEFESLLGHYLAQESKIPIVLVSVVPVVSQLVMDFYPEVIVVDHTSDFPFEFAIDEPSQVGADRLCNMAAAAEANLKSAIVVDAGTATTVDVLHEGVFVGGLIAPGMASAAAQLSQGTAKLPELPFGPCILEAGRTTAEAMNRGSFHGGIGGIEALIAGMQAQFGPLPVVVTGGLGRFVGSSVRYYDPDWTFRGAAHCAQIS